MTVGAPFSVAPLAPARSMRRMTRKLLPEDRVHPAIRDKIAAHHADLVAEVEAAVAQHDVVVVGMGQNPFPRKAKKALAEAGVAFHYLEYGNYLNTWRPRTALKMWSGWPTFPMIFVKGTLVGGYDDLQALLDADALKSML